MYKFYGWSVILSALLVSLASDQAAAVWLTLPAPYDEGQNRYYYPLPEGTPFLRIHPTLHNDLSNDLYITASGSSGYSGALPQPFDFSPGPNLNETNQQNDDYLAQFHVEYTPFPTHFMIIPAGGTFLNRYSTRLSFAFFILLQGISFGLKGKRSGTRLRFSWTSH